MQVRTPITQALQDGVLTRQELKQFMRRSDLPALRHLAGWILMLGSTTAAVHLTMGTPWIWPAMFVHGIVVVHHFALQHECCHYTVFRTRWLNDVFGTLCGLIIALPHQYFRYEHCDHHTHTQLKGHDPELIELPGSLRAYLWYITAVPYWRSNLGGLFLHAFGRISEADLVFLPREARATVIWEARAYLAVYAVVLAGSVATGSTAAHWYWLLPSLLGQPVMRAIRMTEHVGRPNIADMRENTRTNLTNRFLRFLGWNMNYHAEHHYAASVPFHALPRLHAKLNGYVHVEAGGYFGAHREILRQLRGRVPRADLRGEAVE
ncbi:fatty acid desaturase family protein [Defluviimonas sp. WL0002]|uniref:Fatty acid desaturase family protein n=1 Tax=Albidovulum marisflavi TaxID=2984159 RepID=A0ABT2ZDD5_9RHOB|nr:fatty acid desaturase family protein [Defluviimonas sp. WL0002]MCV2869134.1 fatty acid desaturase family protein [Defluviimonas sp. WL0002]